MREALEEERAHIEEKLETFSKKSPATSDVVDGTYPEYGDDEDDNVHEIEEHMVNISLKGSFEKQLRDVIDALERLDNDTYGICKYTGEKIDEKRLRARPTSSSSIAAKEAFQGGKAA